jgi:ribonuclease D
VVQISTGDGNAVVIQMDPKSPEAPRLKAVLEDPQVLKIFHFARFDVAVLLHSLGIRTSPVYCTKIASKIARTYTDRHGLKDLLRELMGIEANKQQQSSDWGAHVLTDAQKTYAAQDVIYLHELKARLDQMLEREGRGHLARQCFTFLPTRVALDLGGWGEEDVFAH